MTTLRRLGLAFIGLLLASVLLFMYVNSGPSRPPRTLSPGI